MTASSHRTWFPAREPLDGQSSGRGAAGPSKPSSEPSPAGQPVWDARRPREPFSDAPGRSRPFRKPDGLATARQLSMNLMGCAMIHNELNASNDDLAETHRRSGPGATALSLFRAFLTAVFLLAALAPCLADPAPLIHYAHYAPTENLEHVDVALIDRAEREIDMAAYVFSELAERPGVEIRTKRDHGNADAPQELPNRRQVAPNRRRELFRIGP